MVKHIIIWKLKEEYNTIEVKKNIKTELEALKGQIPGLFEIRVETEPMSSSNGDLMLYSAFESADALKGYATHPAHVRVADTFVRPYTETRLCFDYIAD